MDHDYLKPSTGMEYLFDLVKVKEGYFVPKDDQNKIIDSIDSFYNEASIALQADDVETHPQQVFQILKHLNDTQMEIQKGEIVFKSNKGHQAADLSRADQEFHPKIISSVTKLLHLHHVLLQKLDSVQNTNHSFLEELNSCITSNQVNTNERSLLQALLTPSGIQRLELFRLHLIDTYGLEFSKRINQTKELSDEEKAQLTLGRIEKESWGLITDEDILITDQYIMNLLNKAPIEHLNLLETEPYHINAAIFKQMMSHFDRVESKAQLNPATLKNFHEHINQLYNQLYDQHNSQTPYDMAQRDIWQLITCTSMIKSHVDRELRNIQTTKEWHKTTPFDPIITKSPEREP
ncbi:hypothetical protein SAMN05444392_103169 [Seinonella peptonophila]|uniref:Uncharacterized protein n=1 Tax=Seinonella peptonophila TaxID=112248 RepID=A0A1M4WE09_9BACL|nr:hypothetical protein [Seinonella peptonophila]SHE79303.1 hypothetical protein SAMN05444392_103169 [Seinonella peptonophila]